MTRQVLVPEAQVLTWSQVWGGGGSGVFERMVDQSKQSFVVFLKSFASGSEDANPASVVSLWSPPRRLVFKAIVVKRAAPPPLFSSSGSLFPRWLPFPCFSPH